MCGQAGVPLELARTSILTPHPAGRQSHVTDSQPEGANLLGRGRIRRALARTQSRAMPRRRLPAGLIWVAALAGAAVFVSTGPAAMAGHRSLRPRSRPGARVPDPTRD